MNDSVRALSGPRVFHLGKTFLQAYGPLDWFFRIGGNSGWGLSVQTVGPDYQPMFSERYGHRKAWYFGTHQKRVRVQVLK